MARRAGSGHRRLSAAVLGCAAGLAHAAQTAPARAPPAVEHVEIETNVKVPSGAVPPADPAVLDYLALYADAADGLDPLGLIVEPADAMDASPPQPAQGDRR